MWKTLPEARWHFLRKGQRRNVGNQKPHVFFPENLLLSAEDAI